MGSSDLPYSGRLTHFFIRPEQIVDDVINFDRDDAHHMYVVLRMRPGQACIALDNTGRAMYVEIDKLSRTEATGCILRIDQPNTEAQTRITIAQALPNTFDKLEWVLQHATEIGTFRFIVFSCQRARENWDRFVRKSPRWAQIVKSAAEQSGRTRLPEVTGIPTFGDLLATVGSYDAVIMAYEGERDLLLSHALAVNAHDILLIVGPEGGFSSEEVLSAKGAGVATVSLGPRILRTETAALVMAAQTLFALEGHCSAVT